MNNNDITGGVLPLNKPSGMTSHDVVAKVRRLYGTRRVGHTGTLDPMANGLLVILVGKAVKAADFIVAQDKVYLTEMKLGVVTDTADTSGKILSECTDIPPKAAVIATAKSFVGKYMQVPPMYSAIKIGGKKLYELARQGISVEREARELFVSSVDIDGDGDTYKMRVACSKGTYIRTLCEDIGAKLGCGAAMSALTRESSGGFSLDRAYSLEALEAMSAEERNGLLIPSEELFSELPKLVLSDFYARLCVNGCEIYEKKIGAELPAGARVRLYSQSGFMGIGEVAEYPEGLAVKLFMRIA